MPFSPEDLGVSESGLPLLRELIHQHTGLYYENGRAELLSDRLAPLVLSRGFRSYLDFYYLLKFDTQAGQAWRDVLDALSVQETYFWRESDQLRALTCHVLPEVQKAAPGEIVRIWSIPCATGEEPLSLAMALEEAGWFARARIEIHASDGSQRALDKAHEGLYRERSFRALPLHLRDKYFEPREGLWAPKISLRSRITSWSLVNMMARADMQMHAGSRIIFCRNAFIYFSPDSVKAVVKTFEDVMPTPGYLFVGASESLSRVSDRFLLEDFDRAFVYVKR
ncbi:MAG TPA: protein-glutamate O-methyltransferase CheR [Vicinamibacterales bacterium]|nr:protein-glutamate O-methyltransferase CheR [Vicinamibacterales bacterium]